MPEYLFDDFFTVTNLDPDGKKFDKGNFPLTDTIPLIFSRAAPQDYAVFSIVL